MMNSLMAILMSAVLVCSPVVTQNSLIMEGSMNTVVAATAQSTLFVECPTWLWWLCK